jgi:hypothetical protein
MRIQNDPPMPVLHSLCCPDCGAPMRLIAVLPAPTERRADEVHYRCELCKVDLKRITKRLET